jgi:hypothetical protein
VFHSRLHDCFAAAHRPTAARCARIGPAGAPVFQCNGQVSLEKESYGSYAITLAHALAIGSALVGKLELA